MNYVNNAFGKDTKFRLNLSICNKTINSPPFLLKRHDGFVV